MKLLKIQINRINNLNLKLYNRISGTARRFVTQTRNVEESFTNSLVSDKYFGYRVIRVLRNILKFYASKI